jgi:hypothetical protein
VTGATGRANCACYTQSSILRNTETATAPQLRKEYNRGGGGILALLRDTRAAELASAAMPVGSTEVNLGGGAFPPLAAAASAHSNGQASICIAELRAELREGQEEGARSRGK